MTPINQTLVPVEHQTLLRITKKTDDKTAALFERLEEDLFASYPVLYSSDGWLGRKVYCLPAAFFFAALSLLCLTSPFENTEEYQKWGGAVLETARKVDKCSFYVCLKMSLGMLLTFFSDEKGMRIFRNAEKEFACLKGALDALIPFYIAKKALSEKGGGVQVIGETKHSQSSRKCSL